MKITRADVLPVGPPVQSRFQIGREGTIARLVAELSEREHTVIAGTRRVGKSTVALAALERLTESGRVVCAIDCRLTPTAEDLALELDAQRLANAPELRQRARTAGGFALRLWRAVLASEDRPDADEQFAEAVVAQMTQARSSQSVGQALDAVERAGRTDGSVVFFDEASALHAQPDAVRAIRAALESPGRALTFLFAGSEQSLMDSLFEASGLLEVHGQPFALDEIPHHMWMEGLRTHLSQYLDVTISRDAVDIILEASGGHPFRTMLTANRAHAYARELAEHHIDDAVAFEAVRRARHDRRWELP